MTKHIIRYDPAGPSGNIYAILGSAAIHFNREHRLADYHKMLDEVRACGSYDMALQIITAAGFELREVRA